MAGVMAMSSRCSQRYIRVRVPWQFAVGMAQSVLVEAAGMGTAPPSVSRHELLVEALNRRQYG